MYGLSLFSGYGGIDLALKDYVRPVLYCDIEKYAQAILLSRMDDGSLPFAPIWNDVTTLDGKQFRNLVEIIYGGFPCQDLSIAGKGAGLAGKRSGLFFEIIRLCEEASPTFIFLENVPAIRTRGSIQVQEALASIGYDCRFGTLSASEVGANHRRERWFCLAKRRDATDSNSIGLWNESINQTEQQGTPFSGNDGKKESVANTNSLRQSPEQDAEWITPSGIIDSSKDMANTICTRHQGNEWSGHDSGEDLSGQAMAQGSTTERSDDGRVHGKVSDTDLQRQCRQTTSTSQENSKEFGEDYWWSVPSATDSNWWTVEPRVRRVANGVKDRAHRIKALGNGVVPLQVKTAFEILMGIKL